MYIQYCTSKQNGKTYTYPLLCKKYRDAGKIKTEVIANLTKFPSEVVLAIAGALKKGKEVLVSIKDTIIKKSIDYGFVFVLLALMDKVFRSKGCQVFLTKGCHLFRSKGCHFFSIDWKFTSF